MDKIAVRIETEHQFSIFKKWNGSTNFISYTHYSRYDSRYNGIVCFEVKRKGTDFCCEEYYKKEGWKIISFQEFERDYLDKKVEGKVTDPIKGNIYRALYKPSDYAYIFRYGTTNTFIRVPVKDFNLNGINGNLILDKLILFEPTKEEVDWFVACESTGKYVDPPVKQVKEERGEVFPGIYVGDVVVSLKEVTNAREVGELILVTDRSSNRDLCYKVGKSSCTPSEWRKATQEELDAYHKGIRNIKDIVKEEAWIPKVGEWVVIVNRSSSCNKVGDVGKITIFDDMSYKVTVENRANIGNYQVIKDMRKAKPEEIPVTVQEPKDTIMNKEELLKEAARRYPIGTEYNGIGPSKLRNCKAVHKPVFLENNNIEVGIDYVHYNGKWAEVISTPIPEVKKEEFKVGDWVVFEVEKAKGSSLYTNCWNKPYVLQVTTTTPRDLGFSAKEMARVGYETDGSTSNDISLFRYATQAEIDKATDKQSNSNISIGFLSNHAKLGLSERERQYGILDTFSQDIKYPQSNKVIHQKPLVMKRRDNKPKLITISK